MRINLAKDPSLRSGTTAAFSPLPGTTLSLTDEYSFYGKYGLVVTKDAVNGAGVEIAAPVPVMAGKPYAFSVYSRLPVEIPHAEGADIIMQVEWLNSLGTIISTVNSATLEMDSDDSFYRIGGVWTAPVGATFANVAIIQPLPGTQGAVFILDALLIEQSNYIGGYFDNISQAEKNEIVNKALSKVPQVINGIRLGADVNLNGLVLNTIDEDDTVWVVTDIDGWWGQADPELPDIPRGTEDGSYDVEGRTKARNITISGFFIPKDPEASLTASLDRLTLATNLTRSGGWLHAHGEPTKAAWVRLASKPSVDTVNARGRTNFQIPLRAGDPIKYHWNDSDPEGYTTENYHSSDLVDEVYTNVATHGTFELPGVPVEVRRNYVADPFFADQANNWGVVGGTATVSGGVLEFTGTTGATTNFITPLASWFNTFVPGDVVSAAYTVKNLYSTALQFRVSMWDNNAYTFGPLVTIQPGATGVVSYSGSAMPATGTYYQPRLHGVVPSGAVVQVSQPVVEKASIVGPFFTPGVSTDPDLVSAWVGTVNASQSTLTGTGATQYPTPGNVAKGVLSTKWKKSGLYSLRQIPAYVTRGSAYTEVANHSNGASRGLVAGETYTLLVWFYQDAPMPVVSAFQRTVGLVATTNPADIVTKQAANVAGEQLIRMTFKIPATGSWYLRIYNGGQTNDPDTYWDDLTIVKGVYDGPPFSGDTPSTFGDVYSWVSTPYASNSTRSVYTEDILTNIGTADVTGTFTITGPAGAGTRIYNASTGQTMELAKPLRGAGLVADAYEVSSTSNIATIKTTQPNGLRVGDEVALLNMVIPFSQSDQTRIVTAVSDVFPYSFSVEIPTDDIDPMSTSGQVRLVKNDVLVIDTYNRAVTYNGEAAGHRNKLTTLTDWIKFAPGDNIIEYFDDVTEVEVISKQLTSNVVTLTTEDTHYLIPGEQIKVALPETKALSKKKLAGNVVTLTTATPHGYAVGDLVDVQSTESSRVVTKSRASNVATLTTELPHGVAVSDNIVVALPATASPNQKSLTSNVATLTFQHPHGFSTGDSITVALPTLASIVNKQLTNNQAILTTSGAHTFSVGDSITVAMPADATVTGKSRSGSQIVITTGTAHGFSVGDQVVVALPVTRTASGNFVADGVTNLVTVTTTAAHGFSVGDKIDIGHIVMDATRTVTSRTATASTVTLTVGANSFVVGERITVSGVGTRYNGSFYVSARTSTTVSYAFAGAAEAATASGGTVVDQSAIATFNGTKVVESTPTTTTFTYRDWDQNANVTRAVGTTTITNLTNQSYNGTKTIISASGTTFAYNF
ncbi:minor tail protein [Microbacterium phage A3Wally]|nr:minor tail protein [Microbacterium phage A3Wally]